MSDQPESASQFEIGAFTVGLGFCLAAPHWIIQWIGNDDIYEHEYGEEYVLSTLLVFFLIAFYIHGKWISKHLERDKRFNESLWCMGRVLYMETVAVSTATALYLLMPFPIWLHGIIFVPLALVGAIACYTSYSR